MHPSKKETGSVCVRRVIANRHSRIQLEIKQVRAARRIITRYFLFLPLDGEGSLSSLRRQLVTENGADQMGAVRTSLGDLRSDRFRFCRSP